LTYKKDIILNLIGENGIDEDGDEGEKECTEKERI
jgi:hypothetical protein